MVRMNFQEKRDAKAKGKAILRQSMPLLNAAQRAIVRKKPFSGKEGSHSRKEGSHSQAKREAISRQRVGARVSSAALDEVIRWYTCLLELDNRIPQDLDLGPRHLHPI